MISSEINILLYFLQKNKPICSLFKLKLPTKKLFILFKMIGSLLNKINRLWVLLQVF